MENTGTAQYLADLLLTRLAIGARRPCWPGCTLLSALITQPMSNAATVVLMVPIAVDTALGIDANILTFVMAVVIGAATSFITRSAMKPMCWSLSLGRLQVFQIILGWVSS